MEKGKERERKMGSRAHNRKCKIEWVHGFMHNEDIQIQWGLKTTS